MRRESPATVTPPATRPRLVLEALRVRLLIAAPVCIGCVALSVKNVFVPFFATWALLMWLMELGVWIWKKR